MSFIILNNHNDYEIQSEYPFHIRRVGSNRFISDRSRDSMGYVLVHLNCKSYKHHLIIAEQFIPNDDPIHKTQIDHINHIKDDNHLENLRWVSRSDNQRNRTSYQGYSTEYVQYDDIPDDIIAITKYGKHELEGYVYSFSEDTFYYNTDEAYRVIPVRYIKDNVPYVWMRDVNNKAFTIRLNKFKNEM